jgi:hypothetical protein
MSGGNWMPELVAMAGGTSLFRQAGKHSPWLEWDESPRRQPSPSSGAFDAAPVRMQRALIDEID